MNKFLKKNNLITVFFIIFFGSFLRFYNINFEDLWTDEMVSYWLSNPRNTFLETLFLIRESNPTYTFEIFLKYFHYIFGYDVHVSRYSNLILSILSLCLFYKLLKDNSSFKKSQDKYLCIYLGLALLSLNIFHIRYSMELRSYILVFLLVLILLINIFKNKFIRSDLKKINFFTIFVVSILMLFSHAFSFLILISLKIYLLTIFFLKKKFKKELIYLFIILIISSIIFLLIYFSDFNHPPIWIKEIKNSFYSNYYFSNFFGSRILGGVYLIILIYLIIISFKKRLLNLDINTFFLILVITTYLLPIIFSYVFYPVLNPRYIFFVLIPVLYLMCNLIFYIDNKKIKTSLCTFLLIFTILNHFTENTFKQFYTKIFNQKPQIKEALIYINDSNINEFSILMDKNNKKNINSIYKNYLLEYSKKIHNNKLKFSNYLNDNKNKKDFWLIYITDVMEGKNFKLPEELNKSIIAEIKKFNHVEIYLIKNVN